ncbi:cytochrome b/b6 domain-containing protein [Arthrobacter sp. 3Tela_A]|uniref:cytochrome b/b6 domain-containing protein n=1 Tax=Arthrobacter sp. 3Tela_A TaxID=3093743 RepID=UPI003BB4AAE9
MSTTAAQQKGTRSRAKVVAWAVPLSLVLLIATVLLVRWLRFETSAGDFIAAYSGEVHLPEAAPVGFPAWLAWQHFLNVFLLILLVRSGWLIRSTRRPAAYWTRDNSGRIKTKGQPEKHSINHWLHFSIDWAWMLNGVVFVALLFVSGQWIRIVPTSWEFIPHAISVALQYASLEWPIENGWVNYNALQVLAYFTTVFIAAPLAAATGFRMSPLWHSTWERPSRLFPIQLARRMHFPVMIYFVAFTAVHTALVLATGARRNLNHMYAARDDGGWLGLIFFALSVAIIVTAWVLARPMVLRPIAQLSGKVGR